VRPDDPAAGEPTARRSSGPRRRGPDGDLSVFVADEQEDVAIDTERWAALVTRVLEAEGFEGDVELSLSFVGEAHIADLNESYLGHTGPTDVLSFPLDGVEDIPDLVPGGLSPSPGGVPFDPDDVPIMLGDIFVCPAVAQRQAPTHAGTFDDEVALLVVHGVLHLLGFDHAADDERAQMQARERELLVHHHGPLARDPWTETAEPTVVPSAHPPAGTS